MVYPPPLTFCRFITVQGGRHFGEFESKFFSTRGWWWGLGPQLVQVNGNQGSAPIGDRRSIRLSIASNRPVQHKAHIYDLSYLTFRWFKMIWRPLYFSFWSILSNKVTFKLTRLHLAFQTPFPIQTILHSEIDPFLPSLRLHFLQPQNYLVDIIFHFWGCLLSWLWE